MYFAPQTKIIMPIIPIQYLVLRSRKDLLDTALLHLHEYYEPLLLFRGKRQIRRYVYTHTGEVLEGLVIIQQEKRFLVASVTTLDVEYFEERKRWLNTNINVPQPDNLMVLTEAFVVSLMAFLAVYFQISVEAGLAISIPVMAAYLLFRMNESDNFARLLRQTPSQTLYSFLPNFKYPTHEDWLVIGSEVFEKFPEINIVAFKKLCQNQGIGLLVVMPTDEVRIFARPVFRNQLVETRFEQLSE